MKKNQQTNITYVFGTGRIDKLLSDNYFAKEFFYSYPYFVSKKYSVNIIEMNKNPVNNYIFNLIFKFFDKLMNKFLKLPFYTVEICSLKNLKILMNSNKLIVTNDRIGLSILPLVLLTKLTKKIEVFIIVMGLFNDKKTNNLSKIFQKFIIFILLKTTKKFVFLGKGEYQYANKTHSDYSSKFIFYPFSIDTEFWIREKNIKSNKSGILFIGNDGNRNYNLLIEIAKNLPNIKFTFITENIKRDIQLTENVTLIEGSWNKSFLDDLNIKEYYIKSKLSIIPLFESYQPSGQSVTLQSMCAGTPVLISKTRGFWDIDNFKDLENIFFIDDNELEIWVNKIIEIYYSDDLLNKVSKKGENLVIENYNLKKSNKFFEEIINE